MSTAAMALVRRFTCPHCWQHSAPEDVLWISAHADLLGDPRLGQKQQQRFLPTRFNIDGNALDAKGFVCQALACPRCHLPVPRALLESEPSFVSVLGAPACGKSYFLTTMIWELRRILPKHFALAFADVDPISNRRLIEYEELLFLNPRSEDVVPLADLIPKTELQGELYDTVTYGSQAVTYPRPFLFALKPQANHPRMDAAHQLARVVCFYDNAGDQFLAGQDSPSNPVTHHLAESRLHLFLFDPTQDLRFRKLLPEGKLGPAGPGSHRASRQEAVLQEAAARVQRITGLSQNAKHPRTLVVVLTKADVWQSLLSQADGHEPWIRQEPVYGLDVEKIDKRSGELRDLLLRVCPEMVGSAESFAERVRYLAVSALGRIPRLHPQTQTPQMQRREIQPMGVTVPLLYGLSREVSGLISRYRRKHASATAAGKAAAPSEVNALWENYSDE